MILHVLSYKPVAYVVGLSALKQIVIGRHFECDIIINELSVSRRHCRIEIDYERREVRLYD